MSTKLALNLESDAFNSFKTDFNVMLRKLLHMMETQEAEEGALNVKMTVKLEKSQARDYQCNGYDGTRDITTPSFSHKVGISMQFKDEKSGSLSGNYEMIYDKELGAYVIANIDNGQTSFFDDEDGVDDSIKAEVVENDQNDPDDASSLPEHIGYALPPCDVIEADYTEDIENEANDEDSDYDYDAPER